MDPGGETVTRLRHDIGEDFASHSAPDHRTVIDHHERLARGEEGPLFTRPKSLGEIVAKNATETVDHDTERSNRQAARYLHDREDLGDHPRFAAEAIKQAGAKGIGEVRDLVAKLFQNNPERGDRYAYDVAKQLDPEQRDAFLGSAEAWDDRPFGVPKDNAPPAKKEETESKEQPPELQAGKGTADPVPLDPAQPADPTPFQAANAEPQADLADSDGGRGDSGQDEDEQNGNGGDDTKETHLASAEGQNKPDSSTNPDSKPAKKPSELANEKDRPNVTGRYKETVGKVEGGSQGYKAINKRGCLGLYQLCKDALEALKLKDENGQLTQKARDLGISDDKSLIDGSEKMNKLQDELFEAYSRVLESEAKGKGLYVKYVDKSPTIVGANGTFKLTEAALIAGGHRWGMGMTSRYLRHMEKVGWNSKNTPFPDEYAEAFEAIEKRMQLLHDVEYRAPEAK
ncbi:MAG: hypothetical protein FJX46_16960 [Alphaproteobacteria bacterium]|nr:hypothetical protein [Alphaproteobacteria bacterium]